MEYNQTSYVSKKGVHVPKDVKEYILKRIKENGKTVPEVAKEHGIGKTAIYNWLRKEPLDHLTLNYCVCKKKTNYSSN